MGSNFTAALFHLFIKICREKPQTHQMLRPHGNQHLTAGGSSFPHFQVIPSLTTLSTTQVAHWFWLVFPYKRPDPPQSLLKDLLWSILILSLPVPTSLKCLWQKMKPQSLAWGVEGVMLYGSRDNEGWAWHQDEAGRSFPGITFLVIPQDARKWVKNLTLSIRY